MEAWEDWIKGGGAPPVRTRWLRTGMGDGWGWRLTNELESLCTKVMRCNIPAFRTKRRVDLGLLCIHAS
jgi:hypothetical protein